jgi:hypothetical protein
MLVYSVEEANRFREEEMMMLMRFESMPANSQPAEMSVTPGMRHVEGT